MVATSKHFQGTGKKNSFSTYRCHVDNVSSCHCTSYERKSISPPQFPFFLFPINVPSFPPPSVTLLPQRSSRLSFVCLYIALDDGLKKSFAVVLAYTRTALETVSDGKLLLSFSATNSTSSECSNRNPRLVTPKQPS